MRYIYLDGKVEEFWWICKKEHGTGTLGFEFLPCSIKTKVLRVILAEPVTYRNLSLGMADQLVPILVLDSTMCHRSKRTKAHLPFYRLRDISAFESETVKTV